MKIVAAYFRQKAMQCRGLAASQTDQADPTAVALLQMADEFEANAEALETRMAREVDHLPYDDEVTRIH